MRYFKQLSIGFMLLYLLIACSTKPVFYELPSVKLKTQPEWITENASVRDTIFIVIHLPKTKNISMEQSIQLAQSKLHSILVHDVEAILRDYWEQKQLKRSETETFQLLSNLPVTLERIMNYVTVQDGWEQTQEVSILCALDYEAIAGLLMEDMAITDRSFLPYFKRRMDQLARDHR